MTEREDSNPCPSCLSAPHCVLVRLGIAGEAPGSPKRIDELAAGHIVSSNPMDITVVKEGWGAKFTILVDGQRRITDILLSGELANGEELAEDGSAFPFIALSDLKICVFDRAAFSGALQDTKALAELARNCAGHAKLLRELLVTTGKRSAERRTAAFILQMHRRASDRGVVNGDQLPFPFRQQDLADVLGLTQVHVSRMLKRLRDRRFILLSDRNIRITDMQGLARIAQVQAP